jgi:hypothetical protein
MIEEFNENGMNTPLKRRIDYSIYKKEIKSNPLTSLMQV